MEEGHPDVLGEKVEEVMSRNLLKVTPYDPVLEIASYMGLKNFRRIPVVDKGMLVGGSVSAISTADCSSKKGRTIDAHLHQEMHISFRTVGETCALSHSTIQSVKPDASRNSCSVILPPENRLIACEA